MKLRRRLALYFLFVTAAVALTTLLFAYLNTNALFRSFVYEADSSKAAAYAGMLGDFHAQAGGWQGVGEFVAHLPERVTLADAEGIIVADTAHALTGTAHPQRHLQRGVPVLDAGARVGTVMVGSMVDSSLSGLDERFLGSIARALGAAALIGSALAVALGFALAGQVARPLRALTAAAGRVASGDFTAKVSADVSVAGGDEIAELSGSFNAMSDELRRLDSARHRIIADSAHELRTPVTLIRGTIEAMIDGVYPADAATLESVHAETLRLSRLIDLLRELEIMESGRMKLSVERLDFGTLAREAAASFAAQAAGKRITLSSEAPESGPFAQGDRMRLSQLLYNLVANAIAYTPEGGRVRISAFLAGADAAGSQGTDAAGSRGEACVVLRVDDSGPGIPASERERVFERFHRLDASRSQATGGSGLGLAIALEIAKAHGARIGAGDSDLGGARFEVSLPV